MGNVRALDRYIKRCDGVVFFKPGGTVPVRYNHDGYKQVRLSKNDKRTLYGVHRLVAKAFIENPLNLPEVNHIDAVRDNNVVSNLEWCTHGDNVRYSIQLGNHVCTRDLTGENNPNYGNHALHDFYTEHPGAAKELLSRPGTQNGRATPVVCIDRGGVEHEFQWIGGCAQFLVDAGYTNGKINSIRGNVTQAIKKNKMYLGCRFYFT